MNKPWLTEAVAAQANQRHRAQLAEWCVIHKIPAPSGPAVDAFCVAMEDNGYGVEETWDAWVWFRQGFEAGALYWNSITIHPVYIVPVAPG